GGCAVTDIHAGTVQSVPCVLNRKVYVIVYDPILHNGQKLSEYLHWNSYVDITQGTIDFFRQVTNDSLHYTVVVTDVVTSGWPEKIDGFRYTETSYLAAINGTSPPH